MNMRPPEFANPTRWHERSCPLSGRTSALSRRWSSHISTSLSGSCTSWEARRQRVPADPDVRSGGLRARAEPRLGRRQNVLEWRWFQVMRASYCGTSVAASCAPSRGESGTWSLEVGAGSVLVATDDSPEGELVPIADVQAALVIACMTPPRVSWFCTSRVGLWPCWELATHLRERLWRPSANMRSRDLSGPRLRALPPSPRPR
jgi:hypothetical protein